MIERTLKVGEPKEENRSLEWMVGEAARDGGLALPIPGRAFLREYQAALAVQDETARKMGEQASANGQSDEAALLLEGRSGTDAAEKASRGAGNQRPEK